MSDDASENGWLCLGRKTEQVIRIGDDIEVKLILARTGWARIGIRAPKHIAIDREEVRNRPEYRGRAEPLGDATP
jgi:carbon storage regulator CsrA